MWQTIKITQKLPAELEHKSLEGQRRIIDLRKKNHYFTLDQIGEETRFIMVLSCLADGSKLPQVLIFQKENLPKNVKFATGVLFQTQNKGWMDEGNVNGCLRKVWN